MIAVDTSALIAIFLEEPEAETFKAVLAENDIVIGWPTLFETRTVSYTHLDVYKRQGLPVNPFRSLQASSPPEPDGFLFAARLRKRHDVALL